MAMASYRTNVPDGSALNLTGRGRGTKGRGEGEEESHNRLGGKDKAHRRLCARARVGAHGTTHSCGPFSSIPAMRSATPKGRLCVDGRRPGVP